MISKRPVSIVFNIMSKEDTQVEQSPVFNETRTKMEKAVEKFVKELSGIRTGRASLALLDGIKVEYYGSLTPLNQVAHLGIPEARIIEIKPWDTSIVPLVEKAIFKSSLNLTPINDGKIIRLNIPPLTEERRKELVKTVRSIAEQFRIEIRNFRRDANDTLKKQEKNKDISEDSYFHLEQEIQKMTNEKLKSIDEHLAHKEKEIMEV